MFTHPVLDGASFEAAALGGVQLDQAANFSYAYVSNCDFSQASLYGVIFTGATLISGNTLQASNPGLQEADFSNAYLADADFTGAGGWCHRFAGEVVYVEFGGFVGGWCYWWGCWCRGGRSARSAACTWVTARPGPGLRLVVPRNPGSGGRGGGGGTAVASGPPRPVMGGVSARLSTKPPGPWWTGR